MLDKLLLLSKGHMMYYGEAQAVAEWFQRLGYAMPYGVNSADFILDMASGDVYTKKLDGEESRKHCIACSEHYLQARSRGYLQGGDLNEELLGSNLWTAAEVRAAGCMLLCLPAPACLPAACQPPACLLCKWRAESSRQEAACWPPQHNTVSTALAVSSGSGLGAHARLQQHRQPLGIACSARLKHLGSFMTGGCVAEPQKPQCGGQCCGQAPVLRHVQQRQLHHGTHPSQWL